MRDVKQLVYEMLTENTGKAMGDSGGAYGRNWERNQNKTLHDFEAEDDESYMFDHENGWLERRVSVFHYLTNNLEIDDLCEAFNSLQDENDNWDADGDVYGVSREAYAMLMEHPDVEIQRTWNTYNGDSDLSQILQGANLEIDGEYYFIIQIHGGCDARGGYTHAKMFKGGDHCDGMIHEYLWECKDSYEINQDLHDGYIDGVRDMNDGDVVYTSKQVLDRIEEIEDGAGDR